MATTRHGGRCYTRPCAHAKGPSSFSLLLLLGWHPTVFSLSPFITRVAPHLSLSLSLGRCSSTSAISTPVLTPLTNHCVPRRQGYRTMMLHGLLLTTRALLLSSVSLRSSHRSISACANSADIKLDGQLQALANALASLPIDVRKAAKRRTNVIVQAVEASLGGQAKVYLAGSQAKHTDIWSSDHDYWVETGGLGVSRTERTDLRDNLASLLTERGWRPRLVVLLDTSVRLYYRKAQVDIVFDRTRFSDKTHSKPTPRFKNNPKARAAVRLIKDCPQKFKGVAIEKAVLAAQQEKKRQRIQELTVNALGPLTNDASQVGQCVAHLNSQLPEGMQISRM